MARPSFNWRHPGLSCEIIITLLFGLLVVGAVWSAHSQQSEGTTSVKIDTQNANTVDIEKMKIGPTNE